MRIWTIAVFCLMAFSVVGCQSASKKDGGGSLESTLTPVKPAVPEAQKEAETTATDTAKETAEKKKP